MHSIKNHMAKTQEKAKEEKQEQANDMLICPHCEKALDRVEWRFYAEGKLAVIGCATCKKVIGANLLTVVVQQAQGFPSPFRK